MALYDQHIQQARRAFCRQRAEEFPAWRALLRAEFLLLYVVLPAGIALLLPPSSMFLALFASMLLGLYLLWRTPGFSWAHLWDGWRGLPWGLIAGFGLFTLVSSALIVQWTAPAALFLLPRHSPDLWLAILLFYPLLSALPQELVFRPLFFRRYATLMPPGRAPLVLNAAVFSFAHLMYWSWIVAGMTFIGGLVFAWGYEERRSFPLAFALHAVAGLALFTAGLGVYFYSGNVDRPF